MIALHTPDACSRCPMSLVCLGDNHEYEAWAEVHLRRCKRCHMHFFTVGETQYLCTRLPADLHGVPFTGGCLYYYRYMGLKLNCFTYHRDDCSAIY